MSLSRTMAVLLAAGQAAAQGVPLPPIREAPSPLPTYSRGPATIPPMPPATPTLPAPRPVPAEGMLPPPRLAEPAKPSVLTPPTLGDAPSPGAPVGQPIGCPPLLLQDVLASLDRHYPLIYAAEQERAIAAGNRLAAEGAFDHILKSQNYQDGGSFANQRNSLFVEQLTPHQGISYFAGYRLGLGNYPVYYEDRKTGDGGEFRAGVMVPLLRGKYIDPARASLAKASIDQALAEPTIQLQRIDIARAASLAYWQWVAAGQRLLIARDILQLAEQRDGQLARRIQAGNLAEIEREDNKRIVIDRQARITIAQRAFQQASIQLSLYLRDERGDARIPSGNELPAFVEPPSPPAGEQRLKDLEGAMAARPEIRRVALQRDKVKVDIDLAENNLLPGVNFGVSGAQDVGQTKTSLYKTWGQAALLIDVPLERRQARGRILALQAEMARLMAQERFARDRVQVEVQNALNGLDRAHELLQRGRDTRKQNQYLAEAELRQFDVGKSDLFRVNIRELQAAEARSLEIDAGAEFYRSLAEYHAAVGLDTTKPPK